jgi:hypothetical protein
MTKSRFHLLTRRLHRWLGVLIGIQFLAWSLGGLYFSWSDMDEVHGDYEKTPAPALAVNDDYTAVLFALDNLQPNPAMDSLISIGLVRILGVPCFQIILKTSTGRKVRLVNALTSLERPPLTEEEAIAVAKEGYAGNGKMQSVEYLTEAGSHHEYREQPLPAYAAHFGDERRSTVYVSAELGTVQRIRNLPWRRFDFLWMLHTMDYRGRDHITNWLLRTFSIFGLLTVASGFTLFFVSRRKKRTR